MCGRRLGKNFLMQLLLAVSLFAREEAYALETLL